VTGEPRPTLLSRSLRARHDLPFVLDALRTETVGGAILLVAAVIAIAWANTPLSDVYESIAEWRPLDVADLALGPLSFHLDLTLAAWAADGLLAIFFFVVGVELKREFVAGSLRRPAQAALPIAAAVGGMIVPAIVYVATVTASGAGEDLGGWGVPVATDIAFALAVLAVVSSRLPTALRVFLLTLAVVDDMLAIVIIAIFYTESVSVEYLALAALPLAAFAILVRRRVTSGWLLVPLALVTWLLVHESGVHATIAGVLLGLVVPVARPGSGASCLAERFEHVWRPVSAGLAIPVFAFFSAGVDLRDGGLTAVLDEPAAAGVALALVVGKPVGVMLAAVLVARFTRATLDPDIAWRDLLGLSLLTGIGFTVSLLIAELAFADDPDASALVRGGVILGSVVSAVLAVAVLRSRDRHYRRAEERERAHDVPPST
jgi:NhaA family Na+:H+ antiporter